MIFPTSGVSKKFPQEKSSDFFHRLRGRFQPTHQHNLALSEMVDDMSQLRWQLLASRKLGGFSLFFKG